MLFSRPAAPELISLHIPKTAGTSFRNILKFVYGDSQVARFDINEKGTVKLNEKLFEKSTLPPVKVLHGHFAYKVISEKFTLPENVKLITWMRDPVKRVISNFYYLESRLAELLDEERNDLNILSKMQRTLIEYARAEVNRNRQAKFLSGSRLSDFDFVGITEHFESDLLRLAHVMNWKQMPEMLHQNKTEGKENNIAAEVIEEIRELNKEDMDLYNQAIQIRNALLAH